MSDIFISYAREDRERARALAETFEALGWSVWWDPEIPHGQEFDEVIERELAAAKCVVALWSKASIASGWVRTEATEAANRDVLVPVFIEHVQPPLAFRRIQAAGLVDWTPDKPNDEFYRLVESITTLVGPPGAPVEGAAAGGAAPTGGAAAVPKPTTAPEPSLWAAWRGPAGAPARRKAYRCAGAYCVTTGFVLLASWAGLLAAVNVDDWLESRFLAHLEPFVARPMTDDIVVLWASDDADENGDLGRLSPAWREHHAELIDALSDAGAKVVVFDLRFEAPSSFDGKLAESVRRAAGRGTSVVVGAASFKIESGVPLPRIAKDLADALPELKWGTLEGAAASRRVQIARPLEDALPDWLHAETVPVVPSLALRTVMEFKRGPSPGEELHAVLRLSDDTVLLRTKDGRTAASIPVVDRRLNVLVNVARGTELEQQPYHEVHSAIITSGALKAYAGKIVLVGYRTPDEIAWSVTRREKRWEMEVQASAISQVLQGRNIRRLRPAEQYAVVLLMGGVGWLLRTRFSAWMRPTLTLPLLKLSDKPLEVPVAFVVAVAAYFLAAFTLFKNAGLVLHFPYDVAALVLSYAVIGWAGRVPVASSRPELVAPRGRPAPQP